jgi:hypothetical protein
MRSDVAGFIEQLHRKDQKRLLGSEQRQVAAIEDRIQHDRPILGVMHAQLAHDTEAKAGHPGVVAISTYGLHWESSRESFDVPWDDLQTYAVDSWADSGGAAALSVMPGFSKLASSSIGHALYVRTTAGDEMKFVLTLSKPESRARFAEAIEAVKRQRPRL